MGKGGDSELGCCANVFRVLFIIFNAIYIFFGVLGLASSIYSLVISETYDFVTGSDNVSGAAVFLVANIVIIAICVVGILGAVFKWRPMLLIYAIFWVIVILLGIISAGLGFYYSDNVSSRAESEYRDGWRRAIESYNTSSEARRVVDAFQRNRECCGIDNATDWVTYNSALFVADGNRLPSSCRCTSGDNCATVNVEYNDVNYPQIAFNRGCYDITVALYQIGSLVVAIVAIIFAIIELFGVVVALGLVCCITSARKKQVV